FAKKQIGSSAMAYKRNPMRSERICSLARYLGGLPVMAWETAATQMLERTLDDSAGRRIYIPDAFRAVDAILMICSNVVAELVVNDGVIESRLNAELPFMVTEDIIMKAVEKGADRQKMHAEIREISLQLGQKVKSGELSSTEVKDQMVSLVDESGEIPLSAAEVESLLHAGSLTGRCRWQVVDYLTNVIYPLLVESSGSITVDTTVNV
ncbi:adenylosuccinate lyase, partial [Candidatus Saccharibacteria bacterium]|nr:adenylosuccinate lyase [Candidatus Saccharibacteria bacterium]